MTTPQQLPTCHLRSTALTSSLLLFRQEVQCTQHWMRLGSKCQWQLINYSLHFLTLRLTDGKPLAKSKQLPEAHVSRPPKTSLFYNRPSLHYLESKQTCKLSAEQILMWEQQSNELKHRLSFVRFWGRKGLVPKREKSPSDTVVAQSLPERDKPAVLSDHYRNCL